MNNPANSSLRYMTAVVTLPNWHKKDWKKVRKNISELLKHARFVYRTPLNSGMYAIKCSRLANKSHLISSTKQANVRWEIVLCGLPATRKRGLDVALPLDNKIITTIARRQMTKTVVRYHHIVAIDPLSNEMIATTITRLLATMVVDPRHWIIAMVRRFGIVHSRKKNLTILRLDYVI